MKYILTVILLIYIFFLNTSFFSSLFSNGKQKHKINNLQYWGKGYRPIHLGSWCPVLFTNIYTDTNTYTQNTHKHAHTSRESIITEEFLRKFKGIVSARFLWFACLFVDAVFVDLFVFLLVRFLI